MSWYNFSINNSQNLKYFYAGNDGDNNNNTALNCKTNTFITQP